MEEGEARRAQVPRKKSGASKYDMIKVRVWLGAHHYVLSRYLISRMLTVTRIPAAKANKIALDLKKKLVDEGQLDVTQAGLEDVLFSLMGARGFGAAHVASYRLVSKFMAAKQPLILLLCGAPWTGKSSIAQQLSGRLNMPSVMHTGLVIDMVRAGGWQHLHQAPLHTRPDITDDGVLVSEYVRECTVVQSALQGDVDKALRDGKPLILEGGHLDPGLLLEALQPLGVVLLPATPGEQVDSVRGGSPTDPNSDPGSSGSAAPVSPDTQPVPDLQAENPTQQQPISTYASLPTDSMTGTGQPGAKLCHSDDALPDQARASVRPVAQLQQDQQRQQARQQRPLHSQLRNQQSGTWHSTGGSMPDDCTKQSRSHVGSPLRAHQLRAAVSPIRRTDSAPFPRRFSNPSLSTTVRTPDASRFARGPSVASRWGAGEQQLSQGGTGGVTASWEPAAQSRSLDSPTKHLPYPSPVLAPARPQRSTADETKGSTSAEAVCCSTDTAVPPDPAWRHAEPVQLPLIPPPPVPAQPAVSSPFCQSGGAQGSATAEAAASPQQPRAGLAEGEAVRPQQLKTLPPLILPVVLHVDSQHDHQLIAADRKVMPAPAAFQLPRAAAGSVASVGLPAAATLTPPRPHNLAPAGDAVGNQTAVEYRSSEPTSQHQQPDSNAHAAGPVQLPAAQQACVEMCVQGGGPSYSIQPSSNRSGDGTVRDAGPKVDASEQLRRARVIQDYLLSYEAQGVPSVRVRYGAFNEAVDELHDYVLSAISIAMTWMESGAGPAAQVPPALLEVSSAVC